MCRFEHFNVNRNTVYRFGIDKIFGGYKVNDEKVTAKQQVSELNTKVNELNSKVTLLESDKEKTTEYQSKQPEIENKENAINENTDIDDTNTKNNNTIVKEIEKQLNVNDVKSVKFD